MKHNQIKLLSLLLALVMAVGILASCKGPESDTEVESELPTETESATVSDTEQTTEAESDAIELETVKPYVSHLEGGDSALIELADYLKNSVNSYFTDSSRTAFVMENQTVSVTYDMESTGAKQVASIKTPGGKTYIENTMDVFLRMKDGSTYLASGSADDSTANIYRLGYYYYDNRIEGQSFVGEPNITKEQAINHLAVKRFNMTKLVSKKNDILKVKVTDNEDPWLSFAKVNFSAEEYNMLSVTVKADAQFSGTVGLYIIAGEASGSENFTSSQSSSFSINTDGEFHTYLIPLESINDYNGTVTGIRFDPNTNRGAIDATFEIKELKAVKVESNGAPIDPKVSRHFGMYSDKLHQTLQITTHKDVEGVDAIGFITRIDAATVDKIILKDKNGTHESLDGADMASLEYIGFDIKDAGVFGLILPYDGAGGTMSVSLTDGQYVITQEKSPGGGKLIAAVEGSKNADDFYMGHRIYNDYTHDFDSFLKAAEEERHPLGEENFIIDEDASTFGDFVCYDSLRGIYTLKIDGVDGFSPHYLLHNNRQYNVTFTVKGDGRQIYLMAQYDGGALECAAILNADGMLIPVPLEVGKNFSDATSFFDVDDARFSETILPMIASKEENTYSIVNIYHKWGAYLLKQISFITYYAPYYHLSTGVHESNCIIPYYFTKSGNNLNMLPDHRAMSSPLWNTDPQHTYCGNHYYLQYTDAEGNYSASENIRDVIGSYGPTYADVTMDYISYDGKIKVTYNHMEMPQTDENRAYYEMKYEVLEDISFADFLHDFSFYSATSNDPTGLYTKVGYLDQNNKSQVATAAMGDESFTFVLGDNCPYVSFFDMPDSTDTRGYSNLSFLIYNYSFTIGGKAAEPSFAVVNTHGKIAISLNLGEVTLKAGDSFTVNAIIMPWGSQESDYSGAAPDKNVRDVRENTLLDPVKATPVADCESVSTVFLPAVKTTNGKSAEFTLSGGENNITVRVFGFNKLTVPVIEEKIDGKWTEVKLSSIHTPDGMGYGYQYDGYMVFYDGDGTFSYSFVTTMKDGAERTFRVTADTDFDGWKEVVVEDKEPFYFDAETIALRAKQNPRFTKVEQLEENGNAFVRFAGSTSEAYVSFFADNKEVTGDLLVIKYRVPASNPNNLASWNFFTSTVNNTPVAADSHWAAGMIVSDGQWQVIVVDISGHGKESFKANSDGTYSVNYLRLDIFNEAVNAATVCDIEYVALFDSMDEVWAHNADMAKIMLCTAQESSEYLTNPSAE